MNAKYTKLTLFILIVLVSGACSSIPAGWSALRAEKYEKAQAIAMRNLAENPLDDRVYRLITSTQLAQKNFSQALAAAQQAYRLDPENPKNVAILQQALHANQFWPAYCETSQKLYTLRPRDIEVEDQEALFNAAKGSIKANQAEQAYYCLDVLKNFNPEIVNSKEFSIAVGARANALKRSGKYNDAILLVQTAGGDDDVFLYQQATLWYEIQQKEKANELFEEYIEKESDVDLKIKRSERVAAFYENNYQFERALHYYQRSMTSDALLAQSRLLRKIGDEANAEKVLKQYIEQPNLFPNNCIDAAKELTESGWANLAYKLLEMGRARFPQNEEIADLAAATAFQLGKRQEAKRIWDARVGTEPKKVDQMIKAFEFYSKRGQKNEAYYYGAQAAMLPEVSSTFLQSFADICAKNMDYYLMEETLNKSVLLAEKTGNMAVIVRKNAAQIAFKNHEYGSAIQLLEPAHQAVPANREVAWLLAESIELKENNYDKAYKILETWAEATQTLDSYREIAEHFLKKQQDSLFLLSIAKLENSPNYFVTAQFLYAKYYSTLGNNNKVLSALELALEHSEDRIKGYAEIIDYADQKLFLLDVAILFAEKRISEFNSQESFYPPLARLYLLADKLELALKTYDAYFELAKDKYSAATTVSAELSRFNKDDFILSWLENKRNLAEDKSLDSLDFLIAKESWRFLGLKPRSGEESRLRTQALQISHRWISSTQNAKNLEALAQILTQHDEYQGAVLAFQKADKLKQLAKPQRRAYILALVKNGDLDRAKANIETFIHDNPSESDLIQLSQQLIQNNATLLTVDILSILQASENASTRLSAYRQRVHIAIQQNDNQAIENLSEEVILLATPLTLYDTLSAVLDTYEKLENWERATTLLEQLHTLRPGDHHLLQKLLKYIQFEGISGNAQKLYNQWFSQASPTLAQSEIIAEYYLGQGDYTNALHFYRDVVQHSAHPTSVAIKKLLFLEISQGNAEYAPDLIQQLILNGALDEECILKTVDAYYNAGFVSEAQQLLSTSLEENPNSPPLHIANIQKALQTANVSAAIQSLDRALDADIPLTLLLPVLVEYYAFDQAIELIEILNSRYLYDDAAKQSLRYRDKLIQARGNYAYNMTLKSYLHNVDNADAIVKTLAQNALSSNALQNAFLWYSIGKLKTEEDAYNYLTTGFKLFCQENLSNVMAKNVVERVHSFEKTLSSTEQLHFQQAALHRLNLWKSSEDILVKNADNFIEIYLKSAPNGEFLESLQRIHEALVDSRPHDAILEAMTGVFSPQVSAVSEESMSFLTAPLELLASFGFVRESQAMAKEWFEALNKEQGNNQHRDVQYNIVRIALLIEDNAVSRELFKQLTPEPTQKYIEFLQIASDLISIKQLSQWLKGSNYNNRDILIHALIAIAKNDPQKRSEIRDILDEYKSISYEKVPLILSYASHALQHDLPEFVTRYTQEAIQMYPSFPVLYLNDAQALNRLGQYPQAAQRFEEAANRSNNPFAQRLSIYKSIKTPEEADVLIPFVKKYLHEQPRSLELYKSLLNLELIAKNYQNAQLTADSILQIWKDPATLESVLQLFHGHKAESYIYDTWLHPEKTYDKLELLLGNIKLIQKQNIIALEHFERAVNISQAPLIVQLEIAKLLQGHDQLGLAEQFIEKAIENYPQATETYHYRALLNLERKQWGAAKDDFAKAMQNSYKPEEVLKDFLLTMHRNEYKEFDEILSIQHANCQKNPINAFCYLEQEKILVTAMSVFQEVLNSEEALNILTTILSEVSSLRYISPEIAQKLNQFLAKTDHPEFAQEIARITRFKNSDSLD